MEDSVRASTARLEQVVSSFQLLLRDTRTCDCSEACAQLKRENERLLELLRANPPPRPAMLPQRRLRLAAAQQWSCTMCGEMLDEAFQCDHRVPWSESFDDSDANIEVCHAKCHAAKTSVEASARCRRRK